MDSYTASDFGILFNQTSYTVVVDHTLALTGIPLVPFTVYFSESVTSNALIGSWTSSLSGIGGVSANIFHLELAHFFPTSFIPPLADSNAIVAASGDNAPAPGNYSYELSVAVIVWVNGVPYPISEATIVNIVLIETPGELSI